MLLASAPSKIVLPFAASGGKTNPVPVASQIGITNGAASYTDGFPPLTRTPVASGGVPPFGVDMNGILYAISALSLWANAGASYPYDSSFATNANVGGYPQGAQVLRSDGTGFWLNLADNNETNPESSPANWVPGFTSGVAAITMTNANVTLTPAQYGKPIIEITGTLTGNLQLIFPNIPGEWVIINSTTGAFTITAKTASGTGTAVAGRVIIVQDGANNTFSIGAAVGALLAANNLSDVSNAMTSLANIGGLAKAQNLADLTSLATALVNLGFAESIGSSGYQQFPGGLILQWGNPTASSSSQTVTLPLTFPNNFFGVLIVDRGSGRVSFGGTVINTSSFTWTCTGSGNIGTFLAIGN